MAWQHAFVRVVRREEGRERGGVRGWGELEAWFEAMETSFRDGRITQRMQVEVEEERVRSPWEEE